MKVNEIIEWLYTQDQEATVEVIRVRPSDHYNQSGKPEIVNFDLSLFEYTDMRKNEFAQGQPWENEVTLLLGGMY